MPTSMTLKISTKSPLHKDLLSKIETRFKLAEKEQKNQHEKWTRAEQLVNAYIPASEDDLARKRAREDKGQQHFTTLQIPYSYAILMSAHTYWTSVFFGRTPVHQFAGRHGESENKTQAIEAIINYQVEVGEMLAPYYIWLYDAGKYGVGVLGTEWVSERVQYSNLGFDEEGKQVLITSTTQGYTGNRVYNVSPYDFFPDPRMAVGSFQKGEFCAVKRRVAWTDIIKLAEAGYLTNLEELRKHRRDLSDRDSVGHLDRPVASQTDDSSKREASQVELVEMHVELIPSEWGLGQISLPEKWVFLATKDFKLLVSAQPLGHMHGRFPFDVFEPEVEAYGLWNRGLPEIMEPLQTTIDWLINTHFYNVRAMSTGRLVVDPSKVYLEDLERGEPGYVLRLKPSAQGSDVRSIIQQLQLSDPTQNHFNDLQSMLQIGERVLGINDQILGALTSGGRKTATEVRTSTGFGVNRLKTMTEYMSATGFIPHSLKLVQNTQQLLSEELVVKIAGDATMAAGGSQFLSVDRDLIAGGFVYVPVDGTLPIDRFAQVTLWKDLLGQMSRVPGMLDSFDLSKIFGWVAQLGGLKNLEQFRVQVAPDDQLARQAQAGNVIPVGPTQGGLAA